MSTGFRPYHNVYLATRSGSSIQKVFRFPHIESILKSLLDEED